MPKIHANFQDNRIKDTIAEKQVAIDGKKLRGTSPKQHGTKGDYIMNAYVSENQLHWNLDVTFLEDACHARKGYAALNLTTIRKLAIQIIKEHVDKSSLKKRRFKANLSNDYLTNMLLNAKF